MKKFLKKIGLSLAAMACVLCAGFGFALGSSDKTQAADAAEIAANEYYFGGAGVRLKNDAHGSGIRFHTHLNPSVYSQIKESGTLMIPEIRFDGSLTVEDLNNEPKYKPAHVVTKGTVDGEEVDLWYDYTVDGNSYKRSTAYLYNIPEASYGARVVAVSYVKYEGSNEYIYTPVEIKKSMTDVATEVSNSAGVSEETKAQVAPYMVDDVTLTYVLPDGSTQKERVAYGAQVSGPTYDKDYYVISEATDQYGNAVNLANYNATLPVTIDVQFLTKKTVTKQWIKDGYPATNEARAWQNGSTATTVTEGIPNGYSSVLRLDWYQQSTSQWKAGGNPFYRGNYDQTDISAYERLTFGWKLETNGTAVIKFLNGTIAEGKTTVANEWIFIDLVQTSANVWSVTVTNVDGEVYYTRDGITRGTSGFSNNVDSIASLLFQSESTSIQLLPCASTESTASVYMTEVIGQLDTSDFDNGIPDNATRIWNHIWNAYYFTGGAGAEGEYAPEETAPKGFSYVSKYSWTTGGDFPKTGHFNAADISIYSDLYFAIKADNAQIYVQGADAYTDGGWLYVHIHQNDNGTWTKDYRSEDGYFNNTSQVSGNITGTKLTEMMSWKSGVNQGSYPNSAPAGETATGYFTDVLAIKKDGSAITAPAAPSYGMEPEFDPEIPVETVAVRTYPWRDDRYTTGTNEVLTEGAPAGFTSVLKHTWDANRTYEYTYCFDTTLDITQYSDLYFATKVENGTRIYIANSGGHFEGSSEWLYAHYTQTSNGVWTATYNSADGTYSKTVANISATNLKALCDGKLYGVATAGAGAITYWTEILAVLPEVQGDKVISSAVDSAIKTDDAVGIPVGFDTVYKYTNFTMDKFAAMDLSDSIYQEISFGMLADRDFTFKDGYKYIGAAGSGITTSIMYNTGSRAQMYVVSLERVDANSWTVTMNVRRWTPEGQIADTETFTGTVAGNSLKDIMGAILNANAGMTLYVTEVRGTHTCVSTIISLGNGYLQEVCSLCGKELADPYAFAHGIDPEATEANDSIWRDNNYALSTPDQVAPAGFNNIEMYRWNLNSVLVNGVPYGSTSKDMPLTCLDEADVSAYNQVWFAMKNVGGTGFYVRGANKYEGEDWLYFHLVKVDDAWTVSLSTPDGYVAENVQTGIVGNTLKDILSYNGSSAEKPWNSGAYPTKADGDTTTDVKIYFTEILGIIDCTHSASNYVSNDNGTHNEVCASCGKVINENITCSGGTNTCTTAATCSLCNAVYGEALGHGNVTWNWGVGTCNVCGEVAATAATVAPSAVINNGDGRLSDSTNAAGVTAPAGFSSVTNLFSASGNTWANKILTSGHFASANLNPFSEVWFAVKSTSGHFTQTAPSWTDIDTDATSPWVSFHLIKEEAGTWTIEIYKDGTLWGTQTAQTGNSVGSILDTSSDGGRIVFYQQTANNLSNADVNIYATEVLGVFNTGIDSYATNVWDHIWNPYYFVGGGGANGSKWSEEAAPEGFDKVTEYTWQAANFNGQQGRFNASDITAYSDIWFAIKSPDTTNAPIYIQGANMYAGGGWLYVHYHQNSDGTWNKEFRSADGYFNNTAQVNLTGTKITDMISWTSGVNKGTYPTGSADVATTAYITNVVGVKKCDGTNHTKDIIVNNGDGTHDVTCRCGEVMEDDVACSGGTATCSQAAICSTCGGSYGELAEHTAVRTVSNGNDTHSELCACGAVLSTTACAGGTATCTKKAVCSTCNTEYGSTLDHTVAEYNTNGDGTHKALCACGAVVVASAPCSGGSGSCVGESTCALCGGTYTAAGNHNIAWSGDTGTCTICGETFFDAGISSAATVLWDHIWNAYYFTGGAGAEGAYSAMAAPQGFNKVSEYTWEAYYDADGVTIKGGDFPKMGHFNNSDISGYSDLYFAIKAVNADIYVQGAASYTGGDWLYVHYHQNSNGTWNKDFRSADGYFNNTTQVNLVGTKLTEIISWKSGVNQGSYPNNAKPGTPATGYFTDVLAVAKCDGNNHVNFTAASNGDGTHNWTCSCGVEFAQNVACGGGTVTCTDPAYCAYCGYAYQESTGHNGAWEGNTYNCDICGETVATMDGTLEKQNVVLFTDATTIAAAEETPMYITVIEELPLDSVSNVTLNGESYAATVENNKIKINVIPKDVYGEYTLTASVVVAGKAFDITAPILVVTNEITTQAGLLSMKYVLRGYETDAEGNKIAKVADTSAQDENVIIYQGGSGGANTMNGNGYYTLGNNIALTQNDTGGHTDVFVWGTQSVPFVGTFDGNGYVIDNFIKTNWFSGHVLEDVAVTGSYANELEGSFFGVVDGTVKNVAFTKVRLGIFANIVLDGTGTLENVYVEITDLQNNVQVYVGPFFWRNSSHNKCGTLSNVVINLLNHNSSILAGDTASTRYPALIKYAKAQNVAVYGFNAGYIGTDGRGNVYYTDVANDGSEYGIYVEYSDGNTNGGTFRNIALQDDVWKIVNTRAYLERVAVTGTAIEPSNGANVIAPADGVEYSLVWNDASVGAFDAAQFISDKSGDAIGALGASLANLSNFSTKQIIVGNYETYEEYLDVDVVYSSQADYGVYTNNQTIFVLAEDEEGFMLAAQELCRRLYNWNQFSYVALEDDDAFAYDEVQSIDVTKVGNYTSHVAFELRQPGNTKTGSNVITGDLGFNSYAPYTTFVSMHNALNYFGVHGDKETVSDVNAACIPAWDNSKAFSIADSGDVNNNTAGAQLCYLGQGDATTFWAMVDQVVSVIKAKKAAIPTMKVINFMVEDNRGHCVCDYCNTFGSNASVTQLIFLNEVKKELVNQGCDVGIEFFAYNSFSSAPITTADKMNSIVTRLTSGNRTITYSLETVDYSDYTFDGYDTPADVTVLKAESDLFLEWTTHEMNHSFALNHAANAHAYVALLAWLKVVPADHINVFAYQVAYRNYFIPLNTWAYQVDLYKDLNNLGINNFMFNLGDIYNNANAQTAFSAFKTYIDSRAMRDINVSFDTLKDEFFSTSGYYGAGGPKMRQFFEELVQVMDERKQDGTKQFVATNAYTDYTGTTGEAGGYLASWLFDEYYDKNTYTNYYKYQRQAFFNGSYAWDLTAMVFGGRTTQSSMFNNPTLTPSTDVYAHDNYSDQAATLKGWYALCKEALNAVDNAEPYATRITLEALFPEFAYLTYHSTYKSGNTSNPESGATLNITSNQPTDRTGFDYDSTSGWYQDFYDRVIALGVTTPAEFYTFADDKDQGACVVNATAGSYRYMYQSMWANWGITA